MFRNRIFKAFPFSFGDAVFTPVEEDLTTKKSRLEVDGSGEIRVRNTGGSSASEGGMGNDNTDDKAKGELTRPGEGKGESMRGDETESDTSFDPIKKNVREKEQSGEKD